jgi:hypothetical protein
MTAETAVATDVARLSVRRYLLGDLRLVSVPAGQSWLLHNISLLSAHTGRLRKKNGS